MIDILIELVLLLLAFAISNFVIAIILKRNDIADIAWGLGFVLVSGYLFINLPSSFLETTLHVMILLWGLRLSIYLGIRNSQKEEDFRYKNWRKEWGDMFYIKSFLQVFLLQTLILFIISLPIILFSYFQSSSGVTYFQIAGILIWLIGFFWESIADYQLMSFKKKNKGIMKFGLWKFSRHPNYFGEMLVWWGIFIFSLSASYTYIGIISPILITFLLFNVSGKPMLESKYAENKDYQDYIKSTPSIIPFKLF